MGVEIVYVSINRKFCSLIAIRALLRLLSYNLRLKKMLLLKLIFLFLFILGSEGLEPCKGYYCLKQYVDKPDSHYAWTDTGIRIDGFDPLHIKKWTGYVLNFTSQQWLTPEDSSRSIWW